VVPDPQRAGERSLEELESEVRSALDEAGRDLASYQRLDDFALTRTQLERTRLGKLRRHLLAESFSEAKQSPAETEPPSPEDAMSGEDRNLLEDPVADAAWSLLRERFEEQYFTPDSSLRYDLGVDSLDWLDLALALRDATGVELDDEAIGRVETVRDLLNELLEAEPAEEDRASLFEQPESVLPDEELERLRHPGRLSLALAAALYALDRWLLRGLFRLEVEGADRLPEPGRAFVLAPNHVSYLDPLAIAAALEPSRLEHTYWGGWTGAVFDSRFKRGLARIVRVLPIDPSAGARRNLAFAAAVLKQQRSLVWFPEGRRSSDGQLQDFRQGIGLLLEHLPAPVVPVAVHGTHEALPVGRRWPRFRRIRVQFGEPLEPDELAQAGDGEQTAERIVTGLQRRMQALLEAGDGS
jgi:long-chain acyl-CoA synthetase